MVAVVDLKAYRGDTWSQIFRLKQGTTPVDLTGATVTAQTRSKTSAITALTATITDPVNGEITLELPAGSLNPASYEYDIEVTKNGVVTTWVRGRLTVQRDISNELPDSP